MKKRLFVAVVSVLFLLGFTLVGPVLDVGEQLFASPPPTGPANDNFADAITIDGLPFSHSLDTSTATLQKREPTPSCAQGSSWGKSVWYAYTPAQSGSVTARTDAWFSTGFAAYSGTSLNSLTEVGASCWGGRVTFRAEAGTTYYFQVGAMYGDGGWLNFYLDGGPPNDDFGNAQLISGLPYSQYMDTSTAGLESGEPMPGCAQGYSWGKSVWYAYTPAVSGLVTVRTGTGFYSSLVVYTGPSLDSLTEVGSSCGGGQVTFRADGDTTYYFQVGAMYGDGGWLNFYLEGAPPNDDFGNAKPISGLTYYDSTSTSAASLESGEPMPSCAGSSWGKSVWYAYSPTESGSVSAYMNAWFSPALAVYSGDSLSNLTEIGSRCWGGRLTFRAEAGTTYYFQVSAIYGDGGWFEFYLEVAPLPVADFWFYPSDPSTFDTPWFDNYSWDPADVGIASCAWDFGDGNTSTDWSSGHQYAADGDYTVQLTVTTPDGRSASTTKNVQVRTHDVAITKFAVPTSARVGQTRAIVVGVNSKRYPEVVVVELYKSAPGGYQWVGTLRQSVPVRPANRTTDFTFSYTFTADDARIGKVTFRATATIEGARDALTADNEAISMPVKVTR